MTAFPQLSAKFSWWLVAAVIGTAAGCSRPLTDSPGQTAGKSADGIPTDVTVEEVAEQMLAKYQAAKTYADSASYVQHYVVRGEGVERERPFFELTLAMERPNQLRVTLKESIAHSDDKQSYDIACDGDQIRVAVAAMADQVLAAPAPEVLDAQNFLPDPLLRDTLLSQSLENVFPQLAMLWNRGDDELVFPADNPPRLIASGQIGLRPCYRLESKSKAGRRVLWVDKQSFALLRMELPIAAQEEELDPDGQYMQNDVWIDFRDPTFDADIDEETFTLAPPAGATLVTQLTPPAPAGPPETLGKNVAEVAFYDADKNDYPLSEQDDKLVVLDFWQIECPPCKKQAQLIDEVRDALGDEAEVEFLAINVDPLDVPYETVAKVWQSWGGKFGWLSDRDHQSLKAFRVRATPTLVVVDKKSRVQYWRPGPLDNADQLRSALDDLLAGKDLAGEARSAFEAQLAERRRLIESRQFNDAE